MTKETRSTLKHGDELINTIKEDMKGVVHRSPNLRKKAWAVYNETCKLEKAWEVRRKVAHDNFY